MTYLYYSIYKFVLLTPSKDEQPEHIANIILAIILTFTLIGFVNIIEYFDINMTYDIWKNVTLQAGIYLCFLIFGYYIFIRNKKYVSLRQKFDSESKKSKIRNVSLILSYLILLIILNFIII